MCLASCRRASDRRHRILEKGGYLRHPVRPGWRLVKKVKLQQARRVILSRHGPTGCLCYPSEVGDGTLVANRQGARPCKRRGAVPGTVAGTVVRGPLPGESSSVGRISSGAVDGEWGIHKVRMRLSTGKATSHQASAPSPRVRAGLRGKLRAMCPPRYSACCHVRA